MEADLVLLYSEIRKMMAEMYPPNYFGPIEITELDRNNTKLVPCEMHAPIKKSQRKRKKSSRVMQELEQK